ncbi:hypothetical protein AB0L71_25360 [Streptomyces sp. NPDC052052]|uniref:hypothetical protein n=1 Tax=Streptomyces sp. NPDC052052 TaxID=3154756 RepID=UPI00344A92F8
MHHVLRTSAVIVAGLVTATALTGCSSAGDRSDSGTGSDAGTPSRTPADDGSDGGSGADAAPLEGGWAGRTDGKTVVLSVASGKAVLVTEQLACTGTVKDSGEVTLSLKCADGSTDRTEGTVVSDDGRNVVVSWKGGMQDILAKTAPGALPSGLPDLPTS